MSEKNDGLMWALVKEKPEEGLWMKRVPIPEVGPNDVKIKIRRLQPCLPEHLLHMLLLHQAEYNLLQLLHPGLPGS